MPTNEHPAYLHVTDTTLTCSGLLHLAPELAEAILEWLHAHGLDEMQIVAGCPVVRDPDRRSIEFTGISERGPGTGRVQRWLTHPAHLDEPGTVWPAPFPQILLDQPDPDRCPSCQRPYDDGSVTR